MKAIIHTTFGSPKWLALKEIPKPKPKPSEVLIKVHAITVNRTDCALLKSKPYIMRLFTGFLKPRKPILGTDFAGTIEEVGSKVSQYKIGDKVFGFDDMGLQSQAEYLCIDEKSAFTTIPTNANFEEATASIEGFHYARNIINKVSVKEGDQILVIGATGAIGSACVQLLKYYNTNITAVCETINSDKVLALGANKVIDFTQQDYTKLPEKYNYIFDAVGKSSFGKCKTILKDKGTYISSELGPRNENIYLPLSTKIAGGKRVKFPFPFDVNESLRLVKELTEQGHFKPLIDRKYTLEQVPEAFEYVESGQKIGNVVVTI